MSEWYNEPVGGRETVSASVRHLMTLSYNEAVRHWHEGRLTEDEWDAFLYVAAHNPNHPSSLDPHVPRPASGRGRRIAAGMLRAIRVGRRQRG